MTNEIYNVSILENIDNLIVEPAFAVGTVVSHTKYNFRAVIIDVDGCYQGEDNHLAFINEEERPCPKQPWYQLLVHGGEDTTYVAECMLYSDVSSEPIAHPMIDKFLTPNVQDGCYQANTLMN